MAKKKKTLLTAVGVVVLVIVALIAMRMLQSVDRSPAPLMAEKDAQLQALDTLQANRKAYTESFNPIVRERSLRDTGHKGVGLFINNAYFRIAGNIAFDVDQLSALLVPKKPDDPVIIDDPSSFVFTPLNGSVVINPEGLTALFNQYLVDYPDTQMRNLSVKTQKGKLIVDGEASKIPGTWLPFHMEGPVTLQQGHYFIYNPQKVEIAGIGTKGLLNLVNVQLQDLLQIETEGTELKGKNNVVLDLNYALPPPQQDVQVADMSIDDAGVHLTFTSNFKPTPQEPIVNSDSYVMIQGGEVKTFRSVLTDVRLQMVAKDGGRLDASLYNYRAQILSGLFTITPAGELVAYLGPHEVADYVPTAQPEGDDAS